MILQAISYLKQNVVALNTTIERNTESYRFEFDWDSIAIFAVGFEHVL
jgi:hypothetical protein